MQPWSCTLSPYCQGPYEADSVWHEREDTLLCNETCHQEEASFVDELHFDQLRLTQEVDTQPHHEWEDEGRHQIMEQHWQEQEGILCRQQEAEYAAHSVRLGQPTLQNQRATMFSFLTLSPL
jgi:hypothetical protein